MGIVVGGHDDGIHVLVAEDSCDVCRGVCPGRGIPDRRAASGDGVSADVTERGDSHPRQLRKVHSVGASLAPSPMIATFISVGMWAVIPP